ncbi:hypothetical protein LJC71_03205 [Desulfosarcina sp. OttesenSCG-928-A07]|nr:hypothetical protein [Desulfosarcina sp. OttesenSCG-928-G17]MDL2328744.1 hypothetical protein [Desulfosarcina sp. OttesenSCG-928-A07]
MTLSVPKPLRPKTLLRELSPCDRPDLPSPVSPIPWNTPALWEEAGASLRHSIDHHRCGLEPVFLLAKTIHTDFAAIFPHLDDLCEKTCPACTDNCCQRARIWADFRDLTFYHLAGISPPDQQTLSKNGDHCRYQSLSGCRLNRFQRPFVCTWYLCPDQTALLHHQPAVQVFLNTTIRRIQENRRRMEDLFIQALTA